MIGMNSLLSLPKLLQNTCHPHFYTLADTGAACWYDVAAGATAVALPARQSSCWVSNAQHFDHHVRFAVQSSAGLCDLWATPDHFLELSGQCIALDLNVDLEMT